MHLLFSQLLDARLVQIFVCFCMHTGTHDCAHTRTTHMLTDNKHIHIYVLYIQAVYNTHKRVY